MTLAVKLHHGFEGFTLDTTFEAPSGVTALFGRSGSGKTTIINALAGLLRPDEGEITLNGRTLLNTGKGIYLRPHQRRLGYIFQEGRLFPHISVRQNLLYGRWFNRRHGGPDDMERVVEMLGIGALLDRRPGMLSGGEKQRVAIGRALLAKPQLILADEPLSALDAARKAEILPYFERLRDEVSIPILYVSHSPAEVARLATTVIVLDQGKIARAGRAVDVLSDPASAAAGDRSLGALIETKVKCHHPDGLTELDAQGISLFVPHVAQAPGHPIRVRIAAQEVTLALETPQRTSALNILSGTVESVHEGDGANAVVALNTRAGRVLAGLTRRSVTALGLAPGMPCHAILKTVSISPEDVGG